MANDQATREDPIGTQVVFENDLVLTWDMRVAPRGKKPWHPRKQRELRNNKHSSLK